MRIYLVERKKGEYTFQILCANFRTVLDCLSGLDGTDEEVNIKYAPVVDATKTNK